MQRPKWKDAVSPLQIDDIVLIFDSGQPRHQWLKAEDGQARYVDVKTKRSYSSTSFKISCYEFVKW
ncbi:hypothetical protein CVS40_7208 [Lucilia cuprina]|nr:hypothetical protein CVS40_7208 [Lucilia cuprina]